MKYTLILSTLLLSINIAIAQTEEKGIKTTEIKTEIFCDHCQRCEDCGQNIYNHIKENKGIKSVKVDDKTNTIIVKYNDQKVTLAEIEKAITLAGYKANNKAANPEAYGKLDGCCKKK